MRTIALICLIVICFIGFYNIWIPIGLYILMGIFWAKHELDRPPLYAPLSCSTGKGIFMLFVLWPIVVICDCYETWRKISRGERFITISDHGEACSEFRDWNSAVDHARKRAKESNERVMVCDETVFVKQFGKIQTKSWFINPDGMIEKLPRYFCDPKWLSFLKRMLRRR